jgi:two-component system, LuxR family, sensor kinase FixL
MLARSPVPLPEIGEIFDDIIKDDERAGQIIARIRGLVRKTPSAPGRVDLNEVVRDVAALVGSEALIRNVSLPASWSMSGCRR